MDEKILDFDNILMGIDSEVTIDDGRKIRVVNFDNAATTPPLRKAFQAIDKLINFYGSIGRGEGQKSEISTKIYNDSRYDLLDFFNIKDKDTYSVIYVNNTTDGINKLSRILINDKSDIVISTRMEHHSNDLPWRKVCKVDYIEVDELGRLRLDQLEEKLINYRGKVKYVSVAGASNVTGYINDIHKIAKIVHKYNAKIIVDGAQLVPHYKVDMSGKNQDERIDFLVFSAHKLYAPFGAGAIIGLTEELEDNPPAFEGGGTVKFVGDEEIEYLFPPEKDEPGTPNFFGVISMKIALIELERIGFDFIHKKESYLRDKLLDGLKGIPGVINYADINNRWDRLGISVFNIENIEHQELAEILAKKYGIAIRQGWFCAHPYCRRLMNISLEEASEFLKDDSKEMPGMIRASLGMYNTESEVNYFLNAIDNIASMNRKGNL